MGEARKHTALGKRFLRPSGWEKSHELQKPVKQDGSPLPWFTYGAIEALERIVRETDRVFEYGAGYSTLWWSAKAAHVTSVEHDSEWIATLSGELADNVRLVEIGPGGDGAPAAEALVQRYFNRNPRTEFPMAAERKVRRGLDDQSFVRYASEIMEAEGPFDIIVIDGMARRLCAEIAPACLAEDGLIVFDNTNRSDYLEGYKTLSEHGFIQIPFWGLVPGADFMTCTSIYGRNLERFRTSNFIGNHFGFPEY